MGETRNEYRIWVGKPEGRRPLGRHRRRCKIILEWILGTWGGKLWTGCNWFRIETSGRLL
jgi:hypothetical protein